MFRSTPLFLAVVVTVCVACVLPGAFGAASVRGDLSYRGWVDGRVPGASRVVKDIVTGTDRGGRLMGYRIDGEVRKVVLEIGHSRSDVVESFYFRRGVLVLADYRVNQYGFSNSAGDVDFGGRPVSTLHSVYFLSGGRLIAGRRGGRVQRWTKPADRRRAEGVVVDAASWSRRFLLSWEKTVDVSEWLKGPHSQLRLP